MSEQPVQISYQPTPCRAYVRVEAQTIQFVVRVIKCIYPDHLMYLSSYVWCSKVLMTVEEIWGPDSL